VDPKVSVKEISPNPGKSLIFEVLSDFAWDSKEWNQQQKPYWPQSDSKKRLKSWVWRKFLPKQVEREK
jgi:hypothetical protein